MGERITVTKIRAALPDKGRGTWRDPEFPGLELRGNKAAASWALRHRVNGERLRDVLGRWPGLDLAAARKAAQTRLEAVSTQSAAGADVLAERKAKREAAAKRKKAATLGEAFDAYTADHLRHLKSGDHMGKVTRNVFGALFERSLIDLTREQVLGAVEKKRRTAPAVADLSVRYVKPFFRWVGETGRGEDLLSGVKVKQTRKRERTLSLAELGAVLRALDAQGPSSVGAHCARCLIATAGRLNEVSGMRRGELDLDAQLWRLPAHRNKSGREHHVHLNSEALEAVEAALVLNPASELVFAGKTGATPFSGWSRFKARIDEASGVADWTWHDARRTFASIAADRGIDAHVADRVLNHSGAGTLGVVARVYQRSEMRDARQAALDLWSDAMGEARAMANGANVVALEVR